MAYLWDIVILLYFSSKDFILSKLFRNPILKPNIKIMIVMSILGIVVNHYLQSEYFKYISMSPIKGAISFPAFNLLFVLADFISTLLLLLIVMYRIGPAFFQYPYGRLLMEIGKYLFLSTIFTVILSQLWSQQLLKQVNWNYQCFKDQMAVDYATYYYRNKRIPQQLSEFTHFTVNPSNNSPLLYTPGQENSGGVHSKLVDQAGNELLGNFEDIGSLDLREDPTNFFSLYKIENDALCEGKLTIPEEFVH